MRRAAHTRETQIDRQTGHGVCVKKKGGRERDLKLTFNLKLLFFKLGLVDKALMLALALIVFLRLSQLLLCQASVRLPSLLHACG